MRDHADVVNVVQIPDKYMKLIVTDLATATDAVNKRIIEATQQMRGGDRRRASKEALPDVSVEDFVLVEKGQAGR